MELSYRIKDWDQIFETAETRKLENLRWVPTPNKHDGLGYRTIAAERDRSDLFAAWNLILQIASKARRGERGRLTRDGRPMTARDMALMTGFPEAIFARALTFFSETVQWLVAEGGRDISATAADPESNPGESPARPADPPASPASSPAEGKEGNGKNRMEGKGVATATESEQVVAAWNAEASLSGVRNLSPDRGRALKARLSESFFCEHYAAGIKKIAKSAFCTGNNQNGWKATFDWLLQPGTLTKVMEGKYDGGARQPARTVPLRQGERPPVLGE